MHGLYGDALPAEAASDVHQTSGVAGHDYIRPALLDTVDFVLKYCPRNVRVLDREESSKAATHFGLLERNKLQSMYSFEDALRLGSDVQLAQQVTGLMQRNLALELRADVFDAEDINEELGEFVGA